MHWFVVHTHPNAEQRALTNLARQGFNPYLPRYLKRRRHARRVEQVPVSLFPGYLFVALDLATARWRAINGTFGCRHLVCVGGDPAPVSAAIIESIRSREDSAGLVQLAIEPGYRPGDRLRIVAGAMADHVGLFESIDDRQRVVVLLSLLGREVRVHVPQLDIEAA